MALDEIDEFSTAYSDDLAYVDSIETIFAQRKVNFWPLESLYVPFLARTYATVMIASWEHMLDRWSLEHEDISPLRVYFEDGRSNSERLKCLSEAYAKIGMNVDPDIIAKYLAIKYLRNTFIHGSWKSKEMAHVEAQGFPSNVLKLRKKDLDTMRHVNDRMMWYIAMVPAVKRYMHRGGA